MSWLGVLHRRRGYHHRHESGVELPEPTSLNKEDVMRRIADFFRTIFSSIAGALSTAGHAVLTVVTAPFRALAKLFR